MGARTVQHGRFWVRALIVLVASQTLIAASTNRAAIEQSVLTGAGIGRATGLSSSARYLPALSLRLHNHLRDEWPSAASASGTGVAETIPPIEVPYYSQRDDAWAYDQLGTCACGMKRCPAQSHTTIADAGCYPTCQAMVFAYYAQSGWLTPGEYNRCLATHGGYEPFESACGAGLCAARDSPPQACRPKGVYYVGATLDKTILDDDLRMGYPAIAIINVEAPGLMPHAVVVVGKQDGNYVVNDPYYGGSPRHHTQVSPESIFGVHRWRGPLPHIVRQEFATDGASESRAPA